EALLAAAVAIDDRIGDADRLLHALEVLWRIANQAGQPEEAGGEAAELGEQFRAAGLGEARDLLRHEALQRPDMLRRRDRPRRRRFDRRRGNAGPEQGLGPGRQRGLAGG